ncbi:MAG: glycosyl hydrolase, partial [Bacteroidota bacterium]
MKKFSICIVLGILMATFNWLEAQSTNIHILEDLSYRSVGPSRGGRATAIEGIPSKPFTFFMGATGGGVWKTEDAGNTWQNISDGQIKAGSIGSITVAPSDENVVYVGTGSACPRGNISQGIGIYKSENGGKKWKHIGLPEAGQIGKIIVHPDDPDVAYVAALGHIFGPNPERGVYRTKDGGESWEQVHFVSDTTGAIDLAINPENPREIFAAFWRAERKPHTLIDGGLDGGIWKSGDGGDTWTKLTNGLPDGLIGRIGLAISPANPKRIWAIIQAAKEESGGLYR